MEETGWGTLILITCIIISIFLAIKMGDKFDDEHPDLQTYKWGFFQGWAGLLIAASYSLLFLINPILLFNDPKLADDVGFRVFMTVFLLLWWIGIAIACYSIIKRGRWGWIVATLLSLNPILWIINGIYVKNRWKELGKNK